MGARIMSISSRVLASAAVLSLVATTACTTNPETGNRRLSKAGIGALAGAALGTGAGAVVGGKSKRTEMIVGAGIGAIAGRSEEHTSELPSLMRNSYALFCLKNK